MKNNQDAIDNLIESVSSAFDIKVEDIKSKSRVRKITDARKALVYFLRKQLRMRNVDICGIINKDHSVVNYLFNAAETIMAHNTEFRNKINSVKLDIDFKLSTTAYIK